MTINSAAIFAAVEGHAMASGLFERVNGHEPRNAPGSGLSAAVWFAGLQPVAAASGLAATSARLLFTVRIYANALQEPQDGIDPSVLGAADTLMAAYSGDFTLGALIRDVDLLGAHGVALSAQPGWLDMGEAKYRTVDITLPMIINDAWPQAE